jgi:hypothetical protein
MPERIHRVLVQRDGQLDEEVVDLAGQRGARRDLGRLPVYYVMDHGGSHIPSCDFGSPLATENPH